MTSATPDAQSGSRPISQNACPQRDTIRPDVPCSSALRLELVRLEAVESGYGECLPGTDMHDDWVGPRQRGVPAHVRRESAHQEVHPRTCESASADVSLSFRPQTDRADKKRRV